MKQGRKIIFGENLSKQETKSVPIHVRVHGFEKKAITEIAEKHHTTVSDIFRALILVAQSGYTADDLIYYDDGKDLIEELLLCAEAISKVAGGK